MNSDSGSSGNQSNGAYANFGFYAWNSKTKPGIVSYYDDYNILRKDRDPDTSLMRAWHIAMVIRKLLWKMHSTVLYLTQTVL